jgi:hypothetical protein
MIDWAIFGNNSELMGKTPRLEIRYTQIIREELVSGEPAFIAAM